MKKFILLIVICALGSVVTFHLIDGLESKVIVLKEEVPEKKVIFQKQKELAPESLVQVSHDMKDAKKIPGKGVRTVLISVDGFRTDLVSYMPEFQKMLQQGAWTLRATTTIPSITTVAHASMFTGQPPEVHGVKHGAPKGVAIKSWKPLQTETIFSSLNMEEYKVSAFVQKEKLLRLLPEAMLTRKVLDLATRESKIVKEVCREVADSDGSRMLIVHLKRFDSIGHHDGWMSDMQITATTHIDHALSRISQCISVAQDAHQSDFALIVTADHGGSGHGHDSRRVTDMHIPWLVIGPGVKKNHEIRRAIQIMDTAAVLRYFLGKGDVMHEGIRARFPMEILKH